MLVARLESGVEAALTQVKGLCGAIQEGTDLVLLCTLSFLQRHPTSFASVRESSWCLDSNKARKRIAWRPKLDSHALGGSVVEGPPAVQEMRVQFRIGKIPWRRKWQPTSVFLPGKFHGQRSLEGYRVRATEYSHIVPDTARDCEDYKMIVMLPRDLSLIIMINNNNLFKNFCLLAIPHSI